jgi:hypothetical protein
MSKELHNISSFADTDSTEILNPMEIINTMIDLQLQFHELKAQIAKLQPAFFTACMLLNTDKISLERAVITKRVTPGQWTYPPDISQQIDFIKQLKQQFHQTHEPTSGRDITWVIKLLLMNS